MRTLYFDCFAGASGDMILGALVAAGVDERALREQLGQLSVKGFSVEFEKVDRSGITCTYAKVKTNPEHVHRHLGDVLKIIYESQLGERVKERAARIFSRLAEAEAKVHDQPIEKIHFHEVGALDAIVDVVGAAICFELLAIDHFVCSPLHVGSGTVEMAHGRFPIPPPAVAELLKDAPVYATDIKGELVTPTGAAIIATVCDEFGPLPALKLEHTGYGAGSRTYEKFPNALRVVIGEQQPQLETLNSKHETLLMLETNIDDLSPQVFGHVMDRALELGALDCYFTPIQMKKNRPGVLLSVLCGAEQKDAISEMLFAETTTLGIRSYAVERRALQRQVVKVETQYGAIDVKVARMNGHVVNEMPEFDQVQAAALQAGVPFRTVDRAVRLALAKTPKG
jgi:pyridinium-3,5-bisthiocarboxylic acid mononucleotide nickel chelatase